MSPGGISFRDFTEREGTPYPQFHEARFFESKRNRSGDPLGQNFRARLSIEHFCLAAPFWPPSPLCLSLLHLAQKSAENRSPNR
jgi:hypothetical protein